MDAPSLERIAAADAKTHILGTGVDPGLDGALLLDDVLHLLRHLLPHPRHTHEHGGTRLTQRVHQTTLQRIRFGEPYHAAARDGQVPGMTGPKIRILSLL